MRQGVGVEREPERCGSALVADDAGGGFVKKPGEGEEVFSRVNRSLESVVEEKNVYEAGELF